MLRVREENQEALRVREENQEARGVRVVVAATLLRTERLQRPIILVIAQPSRAPSERLPAWDALDTANMVTAATDTNSNDVFMEFLLGNDRRSSGEGPVHSAH